MGKRLLNDQVVSQVKEVFDSQLSQPVEVLFFGQQQDCDYCEDTRQLIEELVAISNKLSLHTYDLDQDTDIARMYMWIRHRHWSWWLRMVINWWIMVCA